MAFISKKATILLGIYFLVSPVLVLGMDSSKLVSQLKEAADYVEGHLTSGAKSIQEALSSDGVESLQKTVELASKTADTVSKNVEAATINFRETADGIQVTADSLKELVENLQGPTENLKGMSDNLQEIAGIYTPRKIAKASILGFVSIYAAYKGLKVICSGCSRGYDCYCAEREKNNQFFISTWRGLKTGSLPVLGGSTLLAGSGAIVYYGLSDNK